MCLLAWILRAVFTSRRSLALENLALRQQLAAYTRTQKRPRLKPGEYAFWVALSKVWRDWRSALVLVKPATVIAWHRRAHQRYWFWKCGKPGRPPIPAEHIAFIRRISTDHPEWGEDRIAEELALKLGVTHSTSTVRRYRVRSRGPRGGQTWKTFIRNHASQVFAADFLTQYTALFTTVYIFVVMHVASRRIVLINATTSPGLAWMKQQIRQVTEWAKCPRFLLHDNDGVYGQYHQRRVREGQERHYRCHLDLWLAEVMGIEGIPIPYGAPNASPHIERFNRTLREEALNHFIFLDARHVLRVCREYVEFYNRARPSQALHAIPEPYPELITPPRRSGELIALPVLGGVYSTTTAWRRERPSRAAPERRACWADKSARRAEASRSVPARAQPGPSAAPWPARSPLLVCPFRARHRVFAEYGCPSSGPTPLHGAFPPV